METATLQRRARHDDEGDDYNRPTYTWRANFHKNMYMVCVCVFLVFYSFCTVYFELLICGVFYFNFV